IPVYLDENYSALLYASNDLSSVNYVVFYFGDTTAPLLGSLIARFGPPCRVTPIDGPAHVQLQYPLFWANTETLPSYSQGRISANTKLSRLQLHSETNNCVVDPPKPTDTITTTHWLGFTSVRHYMGSQ